MGAKTKIEQAPTMTPQQLALMNPMLKGVMGQMQGFPLGEGWAGPSFASYTPGSGYGGSPFNMKPPQQSGGPMGMGLLQGQGAPAQGMPSPGIGPGGQGLGQPQINPMIAALQGAMRQVPNATAPQASNPNNMNPFAAAAYSNREQMAAPIVNPFRRNLGG